MFHHIAGTLAHKAPSEAVIEAHGVGYALRIPVSTYLALPGLGQQVSLYAHLHVTDDALTLYGFHTTKEREFFLQLINHVQRVGPKIALAILSGGRLDHLQQAIRLGDVNFLKRIKGVGDANAKRIVLELGKILVQQTVQESAPSDAPASTDEAEPEKGKKGAAKTKKGGRAEAPVAEAAPVPLDPTQQLEKLDEITTLAVKALVRLNEVPEDTALHAVQRATQERRAAGKSLDSVQELIRHALPYAQ